MVAPRTIDLAAPHFKPPFPPFPGLLFPTRYFHRHHEEAQNCVHPFLTRIFDKFLRIELKSRNTKLQLTIREKEYTWSDLRSELLVPAITSIHYKLIINHIVAKKWYESRYLCAGYIFAGNVQKNILIEFSSGLERELLEGYSL
ncbi:hypothetical protein M9H77_15858 [Catharanthus roseus]|uniref:Uncharacterized protein n=1 Tax=Catharanthus roseus TaxID=4058 RepID=A0ACC0B060_CATRO|nr:hypothetical protein M9H77_15858 [Catharanthus roseus]